MSLAWEPSLFPPCLPHRSLGARSKTPNQRWIRELAVPKRPRGKNIPFSLTPVPEGVAHPALQLERKALTQSRRCHGEERGRCASL